MESPWKALSDDNRRQILLSFKEKDMIPTEIAEDLDFTLRRISVNLRILKDAELIMERK